VHVPKNKADAPERHKGKGSDVTEEKSKLADRSDELLDALHRLKDTEQRKRQEEISSESFHRLANEVDAISHEVFSIARDQRDIGERAPSDGDTIEDVAQDERSA
jgi:hypothetical protein